ncbi:MAG: UvrD-helicase domain-containing protein, partial [Oribacterium sp.]|nr:UvrD-helicase domain-containing protein [Oribacterium sp.]
MENLEKILNKEQLEAVRYTEGPLLVLAGAGSGKTRVLTHRVAYLIENCEVRPWNILAITFTNKAAGEMRERVDKLIGARAREVWVSTFHSMCVRILRQHIEGLGYTSDFSIYDTDDQKTVMKQIFKELNIDTHELRERGVLSVISSAKNRGTDPSDFRKEIGGDYRERKIADCYELYEKKLRQNNALDFDDLLLRTIELFKTNEEVLEYYQNRFRYIMVDEYQDTNDIQFMLVQQLAGKYQNL